MLNVHYNSNYYLPNYYLITGKSDWESEKDSDYQDKFESEEKDSERGSEDEENTVVKSRRIKQNNAPKIMQ